MRAFLSHSSIDKDYVNSVAKQLGRQFCIYDLYSFDTGEDFRLAIRKGLDLSSIFVLFASKAALNSIWVRFEQDEAEIRAIKGLIKRPLVFTLESLVTHRDLPDWLSRGRVVDAPSPKAVARQIQHYLQECIREQQQPIFVGRHRELTKAETTLLDHTRVDPHRVFAVHGLSGIGRRTLAGRIGRDLLNLPRSVIIRVEEGDSIQEVAAKVAEHAEVYTNVEELKSIVDAICQLPIDQVQRRVEDDLEIMTKSGEFPLFFDAGGLLDNDGYLNPALQRLVADRTGALDSYMALVSARKMYQAEVDSVCDIPTIRVEPLSTPEVERLMGTLAARHGMVVTGTQIKELAEYVRGYPPAAHYAIELAREYGVAAVLADKYPLVQFRTSHFIAYIARESILKEQQRLIAAILSYYSPLPLAVIGNALGLTTAALAQQLEFLIDTCIVVPDDTGLYALADPVTEAAQRLVERAQIPHSQIAEALDDYLREDAEPSQFLALSRSLFRARRMAGHGVTAVDDREIRLVSDLIALETECYHSRDYTRALEFGMASLQARPESNEARTFVIRALAQLGRFPEAEKHIDYLRSKGQLRDAYFLEGFMARLQGKTEKAAAAYEEALNRGRRGLAVQRELANCYFIMGDLPKARRHIAVAQEISPDNRYVIDLQIIIAVNQRDEEAAKRGLSLLKSIDRPEFFSHRLSTVEFSFGRTGQAYEAAKVAMSQTERPTFAMFTQVAKTAIACNDLEHAMAWIVDMESRFRGIKEDIKVGLRCRWEIAAGQFRNALTYYEKLNAKDRPVHKALRRDALRGILGSEIALPANERHNYEEEVKLLDTQLDKATAADLEIVLE